MLDELMTITELAARFKNSKRTIYRWRTCKHLNFPQPTMKIKQTCYWRVSDIQVWEAKHHISINT